MSIYPPTGTLEIKNATLKIPVVDLQYTSNTAKLEANSNVVTEFSRSKKLIKYPRVALNSASQDGYVVTASTDAYDNAFFHRYDPFRPFVSGSANGWHSGPPHTSTANSWDQTFDTSGYNKDITSYGVGGYAGTSIAGIESEWLKLELPHKIVLSHLFYQHRDGQSVNYHQAPKDFRILGSNDDIDWDTIKIFTGQTSHPEGQTLTAEATKGYKYLAFVVTATQTPTGTSGLTLKNLEYYGVPEYDPEAHGTDVTVKSYPNVPNTDWLEVYYDAKDLTNISGTIADLSGKSVTGSLNGDVSIDTLNDVKSFSFDGSGDYISGTLTNTGDFNFTVSTWVFETNGTTNNTVWMIGSGSSSNNPNPSVALGIDSAGSLDFFVFSGIEIRMSNFRDTFGINKWHHIVCTRTGTTLKYFINGIDQGRLVAGSDTLSIAANSIFNIGARTGNQLGNNPMHGKIANFRLFNRVLTTDEIYQLYAYQKEYFGHGDLSMTLKAGRLGIGTSEPRVALDVRGEIRAVGSMLYLLDTPLTHEWHWSGSTSSTGSEQRIHYNQFPPNCRAIYADVFLPMASAGDHGTHILGESWKNIGRTWTDGRSLTTATTNNARPSTYMTTGVTQGAKVVYIGQPSQSDNFEYYYGNWWQSLIIPLGDGNNLYHGRTGYGGTYGWIYVYTKGYYV